MSRAREFPFRVTNGRVPEGKAKQIAAALQELDGKQVVLSIREQKRVRSLNQNSFYQGPFIEYIRQRLLECGYRLSHDDIHAGLRDKYAKNGYTLFLPDGTPFKVPPSTTRLPPLEFEGYLEEIRADYAERFGWQLPLPNENET